MILFWGISEMLPLWYLCKLFSNGVSWCLMLWGIQRIILPEELKFKGQENASLKEYVHVRINISGSPLEFPGWIFSFFLFMLLMLLSLEIYFLFLFSWCVFCLFRNISKHWSRESETSWDSSHCQGNCYQVWSNKDDGRGESVRVSKM